MKVLLNFHLGKDVRISVPESVLADLRRRFPALAFVAANDPETLAREAADADVFYGFRFPAELLARAPRLRWIQSASAGIEELLHGPFLESDVVLTNAAGIAAIGIAEHVLGVILIFCRNHHVAFRLQQEARWDRAAVMAGTGTPVRELSGGRVAVLGLGPIGLRVATGVAALGATVRGMRRHPPTTTPPPFDAVVGPSGLDELLGWADFVVLAVPHTAETDHLLGARELGLMRPDAYLINIARGSVVDEAALVAALERGAIAGAGLDVFVEEPLPPTSPLWRLSNAVVTPHAAGATPRYFERAHALFVDNLERWLSGRALRNVVDRKLGYPTQAV